MKIHDLFESKTDPRRFVDMMEDFLPLAMEIIGLDKLPSIKLVIEVDSPDQPTFGKYVNDEKTIYLALKERHPLDIARTLAHELVHFKQDMNNQLDHNSGNTGSPEENQAHEVAGVVMRHFNKQHSKYFQLSAISTK